MKSLMKIQENGNICSTGGSNEDNSGTSYYDLCYVYCTQCASTEELIILLIIFYFAIDAYTLTFECFKALILE